jgi:aminobutyraldehyde dehydrogenase
MLHASLLIDGELVTGHGPEEPILDPATGRTIARVKEASPEQVDRAVAAAVRAFGPWSRTTPQERSLLLLKLADRLEADGGEYAALESLNCGKPRARVLPDELPAIVDCFRFFAGAARVLGGSATDEYIAGHTSMIRRDPVGVVAQITPWNYPLMMAAWKLAPALAAGNTVVL